MTNQRLFSILFIFSLLVFTSCDKDDDATSTIPQNQVKTNLVAGDKGSNLKIKMNGQTKSCIGTNVFNWVEGNLLSQRRWKQISMGCEENSFAFRISTPPGTFFEDIAVGAHSLFETRLLLEDSPDLAVVYPEFYVNQYNPEIVGNATGIIEIMRDVVVNGTTYSVVGNINASFYNNGSIVTVQGQFWNKNATW